ncbi:MAG: hypothetical protein A2W77_07125 [Nitrospinae bacterium RIFCSPLOWO2_12_39_16]|nr:MAG: hypothetical protein A2W77_07125 [Nitrospinae bacterium RIFCSPLOWO2_12_39_16]
MESKKFDCVEMKRKGAEFIYKKVAGLSKADQLKFWRAGDEELRKIIGTLPQKGKKTVAAGN